MRVAGIGVMFLVACGGNPPVEIVDPSIVDTDSDVDTAMQAAVEEGATQIRHWLSDDFSSKIKESGKLQGAVLVRKIAENSAVRDSAYALASTILNHKSIEPTLNEINNKATIGFTKQLTLGWRALKAGGIEAFRQKVSEDATRVGIEVLATRFQDQWLKDERTMELFNRLSSLQKVEGKVAAIALNHNVSPPVTEKTVSIALRIAADKDYSQMTHHVQTWIQTCQTGAAEKIDGLLNEVAALPSVEAGLSDLAIEVMNHPKTSKVLVKMVNAVLKNSEVQDKLVLVYEAVAFEKGDETIRSTMEEIVSFQGVDAQIFKALNRLAQADGAATLIGKHLDAIAEAPNVVETVEQFVVGILDSCSEPS